MATLFIDGFDKYGPPGTTTTQLKALMEQGEWTLYQNTNVPLTITTSLTSSGYGITYSGGGQGWASKTLAASYSRLIGGIRVKSDLGVTWGSVMQFTDAGSAQCSIQINGGTGLISLRNGGYNGGVIATSTTSVSANSIHYIEWDITFGAAAAYMVYLDGIALFPGSPTGNTKTTANTTANGIVLGNNQNIGESIMVYDDLYLFDTSTSFNNAVLLTSPRIETRYPTSDTQTQWTNAGNVIVPTGLTQTGVITLTATTNAPGAGQLVLIKVLNSVVTNLQSVGIYPAATSAGAKFKAVLYTDSAGSPNALVATGTEIIGTTANTALSLPFGSGQALSAGTNYWIGYITDTSVALNQYDNSTVKGQKAANTYVSGAPGTAPAMTTAQPSWVIWGNATGAATNWESVSNDPVNGAGPAADNGTLTSSTVGNEDLYGFPALSTTANNVYTIAVKINTKRSDTGARTLDCRVLSSGTDGAGSSSGQTPGTTYTFLASYFDRDPATPGTNPWSNTTANAATAGPKIAS